MKFRQFVQEEDAMMGEADFAGSGHAAAADHAGVADGVMRRAEGARRQERFIGLETAERRVDPRGFEALGGVQRRQDGRQSAGQHGLAGARGADHQHDVDK